MSAYSTCRGRTEPVPVGAGQPAIFLEPLEGVVVEHLCPEIGVIAGCVPVAPDVHEVTRAVPGRHGREVDVIAALQRLGLESVGVLEWRVTGSVCQDISSSAAANNSVSE